MKTAPAPLGVYIHWPFCKSKCPYCDFNSHVREGIDHKRWRAALLTELEYAAIEAPSADGGRRRVETIFFGGGTPSLMEPETVAALIQRTHELWDTAADVEITSRPIRPRSRPIASPPWRKPASIGCRSAFRRSIPGR